MEGHVSWILECSVKDGQRAALDEVLKDMIEGTSTEPGALAYEWYISEDGTTLHGLEKYASSEAAIAHLNGFIENWARRFFAAVDVTRYVVYGDPSPAAREILDASRATYMDPMGGFSRFS